MKKILITGASGFLASKVIELAELNSFDLTACTGNNTALFRDGVKIISRDETVKDDYDLSQYDIILNCAYPMTNNGIEIYSGIEYLYRLIDRSEQSGVRLFINISSQSLYDPKRNNPAVEEDKICLYDVYSAGKYCVEKMLQCSCINMIYTNIRMASLIGIGLDKRIVNRFIDSVIEKNEITVIGGTQRFEYMDVSDAARGILKLVSKEDSINLSKVYNLGAGVSYDIVNLAKKVMAVGEQLGYKSIKMNIQQSDVFSNNEIDSSRFYTQMDWSPEETIEDSIKKIYEAKLSIYR